MNEGITAQYKLCQQHLTKRRWVYVLVDVFESCHLCCLTLTAKVLQPANLSSAALLEPVFMYKGAQVILFSFEPKSRYMDINHLLMRFHHHMNLISGGS